MQACLQQLINRFFHVYFNPRTRHTRQSFQAGAWVHESQFWVEGGRPFCSYYLSFCAPAGRGGLLEVSGDVNRFLLQNARIRHPALAGAETLEHFYSLIVAAVGIFYIDATALYQDNFVDNKALALYQLARTVPSSHEDRARTSWLRYLLYNAHLYEARLRLSIRQGRVYFRGDRRQCVPLRQALAAIQPRPGLGRARQNLLVAIFSFLQQLTGFFEQGAHIAALEQLDDLYLPHAHYGNFLPTRQEAGQPRKFAPHGMAQALLEAVPWRGAQPSQFATRALLFACINMARPPWRRRLQAAWTRQGLGHEAVAPIEAAMRQQFDFLFDFLPKPTRLSLRQLCRP